MTDPRTPPPGAATGTGPQHQTVANLTRADIALDSLNKRFPGAFPYPFTSQDFTDLIHIKLKD